MRLNRASDLNISEIKPKFKFKYQLDKEKTFSIFSHLSLSSKPKFEFTSPYPLEKKEIEPLDRVPTKLNQRSTLAEVNQRFETESFLAQLGERYNFEEFSSLDWYQKYQTLHLNLGRHYRPRFDLFELGSKPYWLSPRTSDHTLYTYDECYPLYAPLIGQVQILTFKFVGPLQLKKTKKIKFFSKLTTKYQHHRSVYVKSYKIRPQTLPSVVIARLTRCLVSRRRRRRRRRRLFARWIWRFRLVKSINRAKVGVLPWKMKLEVKKVWNRFLWCWPEGRKRANAPDRLKRFSTPKVPAWAKTKLQYRKLFNHFARPGTRQRYHLEREIFFTYKKTRHLQRLWFTLFTSIRLVLVRKGHQRLKLPEYSLKRAPLHTNVRRWFKKVINQQGERLLGNRLRASFHPSGAKKLVTLRLQWLKQLAEDSALL